MTFPIALLKSSTHNACEYDSLDSDDTTIPGSRIAFALTDARSHCLPQLSYFTSSSLSATRTPLPSRSVSPFRVSYGRTSSDTDDEPASTLLRRSSRDLQVLDDDDDQRRWWSIGNSAHLRRRRGGFCLRTSRRRWTRRLLRHPIFPRQPITIVRPFHTMS